MEPRAQPPWRNQRSAAPPSQHNQSSVLGKRPADSRAQNDSAKRRANPSTTAQEEAWVADEDRFVLQQSKKKAAIRVKAGRAKPIDWLAVTLRFIDPTRAPFDDEVEDHELDVVDPVGFFEGLGEPELLELQKDIDSFLNLESNHVCKDYWSAVKVICKDHLRRAKPSTAAARGTDMVAKDINKLLEPKTYEQLEGLEVKIKKKLNSDEDIDFDYWEQLLRTLRVFKAKARLRRVSQDVVNERLQAFRNQQEEAAVAVQKKVQAIVLAGKASDQDLQPLEYGSALDPKPALKLRPEDKELKVVDEADFLKKLAEERRKVQTLGYVPAQKKAPELTVLQNRPKASPLADTGTMRFAPVEDEDYSQAAKELYEREVARGVNEDEEIFTAEETITAGAKTWAGKYKPRKPRYFNRVQMGYEWNKYNQTHYDHDNPPPKVVQGYKFNIFYPDLIEKNITPTYRIERENGRKKGQSFTPAGEDDTCVIRFIAGAPYEDLAFRIVDKEWDYGTKRERGFRSTFDKGILQLHFNFKKVYYRK
ncbi:hypothetical protein P154DRAFT_431484 [Amniculicola lignicola CBS 123094]|uniref:Splicing factor Cactin n=1 Tax=Amniculicola lignicola CBS 123094 TaxID=1392246 RepID=A0A6A5WK22_9PLEO|nr:hypothetical protein P154DRAFT_431484 [Amniculicola lignicola CBS 123094]